MTGRHKKMQNKMTAEEITKGSTLLATLNDENFPFGMHKDLIDDLHRMINVALNTPVVSDSLKVDYFVNILKRALDGNDDVKVEFENEHDQMDYILDVCNNFKKELEKDEKI